MLPTVPIREISIAALGRDEDTYTEPPGRELSLAVIGGQAHISVAELDGFGNRVETSKDVVVDARSLLLALQAAVQDGDTS